MRKSRLKILPARSLTTLGFLLLYLACPIIGDMSRARPSSEHNLMLRGLSGLDGPGDGDIRDYPEHHGGTDRCQDPLMPTCNTLDNELDHCVSVAKNHTGTPDNNIPEHEPSTPDEQSTATVEKGRHPHNVPLAYSGQTERRASVRRVSTSVNGIRRRRLLKSASRSVSNARRVSKREISSGPEARRTNPSRRTVRGNSLPVELRTSRSNRAAVQTRTARRQTSSTTDVRREIREVSRTRRSVEQPSVRQSTSSPGDREPDLRRAARNTVSENRRFARHEARSAVRREILGTRTTSHDSRNGRKLSEAGSVNRRFAANTPEARIVRTDRVAGTLKTSMRRQNVVSSSRRMGYVNIYRDARMAAVSNKRIDREHPISRNIRSRAINTPSANMLVSSVSRERSTNRKFSIETVKVSSLSMETLMPKTHPVKRSVTEVNNTSASEWASQYDSFPKSYSDTDFDMSLVFGSVYNRRKLSTSVPKTRTAVHKASVIRDSKERIFDSRRTRISRTNNYRLPAKLPHTIRLIRRVNSASRVIPDVYESRKFSRAGFETRIISYSMAEMRRSEHQKFRGKRHSENISGSRRLTRSFSVNRKMSYELPIARTRSRETLSRETNRIFILGARILSLNAASPKNTIRRDSLNRRLGGFIAAKRLTRVSSLVRTNSLETSDFRTTLTSRTLDTRRKRSAGIYSSKRFHLSKSSSARKSVEATEIRQFARETPQTRENIRVPYSRKLSDLSDKLHAEQHDVRSSGHETFSRILDKRTVRTMPGSRAYLTPPRTTRKASGLSAARQYSSEGRVSNGRFRATSTNPTLLSVLHRTRASKPEYSITNRKPYRTNSRRTLLAVNPTETSLINMNRNTVLATSRMNRLDSGLLSGKRLARGEIRERKIRTRISKLGVIISTNRMVSLRKTDSKMLSSGESFRRNILSNELRTVFVSSSRLMERRLSGKLSKARKVNIEVPQSRRISTASERRKSFSLSRITFIKYSSDDDYARITYSSGLLARIRTEQHRLRRTSITRRYTTRNLSNRMVTSMMSVSSSSDVYRARKQFDKFSVRRFNTASQQRFNTASSANRRVLLKQYVDISSDHMNNLPSTRRNAVYFIENNIRSYRYGNQVLHPQPYVPWAPKYTRELKSSTEKDSTNAVSWQRMQLATRKLEGILSFGTNITVTDFSRKEQCVTDLSTHLQFIEVIENIPATEASPRKKDVHAIIMPEIKHSWFSDLVNFARVSLSTWLTYLSAKLSSKESEFYFGKFCDYNTYIEIFQDLMEQTSKFSIIQMAKNSLVPEVGNPKQPILVEEKTGLGLVGGGIVGTALLLSARYK